MNEATIAAQLQHLRATGFDQKLAAAAAAHGLAPALVFAIASRETGCRNLLGDIHRGEARGVGILQIDVQFPIARRARNDGTWATNPDPLIAFGVAMLAGNLAAAERDFPLLPRPEQLRIAADGYHEGMGRAARLRSAGPDPDSETAGGNYGRDVVARMEVLDRLLRTEAAA